MKMFMLLIVKNVVEQCRDIKRNSLFIILPMAIFICFYSYFQLNDVEVSFVKPISVGVFLEDDSIFSKMLVDDFKSKRDLSQFFQIIQGSRQEMLLAFEEGIIDAVIEIPEGFVSALMSFDYLPMKISMHNDDPVKTMILYNGFIGYEHYISSVEKGVTAFYDVFREQVPKDVYWEYNDALSVELIMTVLSRNEMYEFKPIVDIPSVISVEYYFISLTVMFIFLSSLFSGLSLIKEMKSQAFNRLQTTKVSIGTYLVSKIFGFVIMIFVLVLIWTSVYSIVVKKAFVLGDVRILLFVLLIIIGSVVGTLLLTLFITNEQELLLFSSVFVFLNAIIGGSIIPIHYMPETIKMVAKLTPNYYSIRTLLFLSNNIPYEGYLWVILLMVIGVVLSTYLLCYLYSKKLRRGYYG